MLINYSCVANQTCVRNGAASKEELVVAPRRGEPFLLRDAPHLSFMIHTRWSG
jgi:hypothetical protein